MGAFLKESDMESLLRPTPPPSPTRPLPVHKGRRIPSTGAPLSSSPESPRSAAISLGHPKIISPAGGGAVGAGPPLAPTPSIDAAVATTAGLVRAKFAERFSASSRSISDADLAPASAAPSTPKRTTFITSLASSFVKPASARVFGWWRSGIRRSGRERRGRARGKRPRERGGAHRKPKRGGEGRERARRTLRELDGTVRFLHVSHGDEPSALQFLFGRRQGGETTR